MNIRLIMIAKSDIDFVVDGMNYYQKKLHHLCKLETIVISNNKKIQDIEELKKAEGKLILDNLLQTDVVILLDNNGKTFHSKGFANYIAQKENQSVKRLSFIIGGAYGFSNEIYERANDRISLSELTFSHQIVRVIFLEQLYRAYSIIKGLPYHHE